MNRIEYAIKTIDSAAHLLASCEDAQVDVIMARMTAMLNKVWLVEFRRFVEQFWDAVSAGLVPTGKINGFCAIHGEEANPPGQEGNVHISFQPHGVAYLFHTKLSLLTGRVDLSHEPQKLHVKRSRRPHGGAHRKRARPRRR